MSLKFGKGNRSIAFNPTSAFPLDARYYFESYELAAAAAQTAEEAGSTNTQYYFGQQIVVVENNTANFYIIQPDGTLSEVGGKIEIDTNVFEYIDNKLNLYGFTEAVAGAQLTKDSAGKLSWIKPDTTTVQGLSTAIANLQKDLDENYYTKLETEEKIAATAHLKRKEVSSLSDIDLNAADADQYIYMIPVGLENEDNKYYEYIIFEEKIVDDEGIETTIKTPKLVGTWEVNLSEYAKLVDLNNKVDKDGDKVLISPELVTKLENLSEDANENYIKSVSDEFQVNGEGHLSIVKISQDNITGLKTALDNKVSVEDGKGLSSNDFTNELKTKLETINVNALNNMQTAVGQLSKDIYGYIDETTGKEVDGLSDFVAVLKKDVTLLSQRADKADGNIVTLNQRADKADNRINTIEKTINNFDKTYVSITNFNTVVGNMDSLLEQQINIIDEINNINERLTWGIIPESN